MKSTMLLCLLLSAAPTPTSTAPTMEKAAVLATPVTSVTSTSGRLRIEVLTDSVPLRRGPQRFLLRVTEAATGSAIPDTVLAIQPWMPTMGHGLDSPARITRRGTSDFEVTELDLFMPGPWELRLTLTGPVEDTAVVRLQLAR
ncbi:hypothetical protein ACN469_36970 [Corallococcus terminator]